MINEVFSMSFIYNFFEIIFISKSDMTTIYSFIFLHGYLSTPSTAKKLQYRGYCESERHWGCRFLTIAKVNLLYLRNLYIFWDVKFGLKIFQKIRRTRNWIMKKFSDESLDQEKHFKYVFEVGLGENLRKYGSKWRTFEALRAFTGSYKK